MRENRTYGSEGGEAKSLPYPLSPETFFIECVRRSATLRKMPIAEP